jgi:feruloyl-CoA synthase
MIAPLSSAAGPSSVHDRFHATRVLRRDRTDGAVVLTLDVELAPYPARYHDWLFQWAAVAPNRVFLAERAPGHEGWATITYAEAAEKVERIAAALAERDLSAERPIVVLSGNSIDHQLLGLAGMLAGVPHAPVSVAYSLVSQDHGKLRHILKLLDPGLVYASHAEAFANALNLPEMAGREIVTNIPFPSVPGATLFSTLLAGGSAVRLAAAREKVGPETIAKFLFTSGSAGIPKAVVTTHKMLCANAQMANQVWAFLERRPPVLVDWLPWSHVFGGNHNMGQVLRNGGTMYIDDGKPLASEVGRTLRNLSEVSPTAYFNVPRGYDFLLPALRQDAALRKRFFADLDCVFYAGASLPEHLWDGLGALAETSSAVPPSMLTGWGLTETSPTVTVLHRHGGEPGNIGVPLPGVELKLVPNGRKWEARVRGPNVMPGYWRMPEQTAKAFDREGFLITGDAVLFIDEQDAGRGVRFNGRITEDFKLTTGTWVHTAGVRERALKALGALATDVVVTGPDRPDVGLFIFPSPATAGQEDYRERLTAALRTMNEGFRGSSEIVARALIMTEPPSLDKGEMTDKGSLNMLAILEHRRALLEQLYTDADPDVLRF